ncbi:hypothetical protein O7635_06635 [Asanoa sp. WMMD1127]|uniref:hypothetical protein n=1 Tax=Asanoa sp. WMMD1127 TaxID=3016107 RepID=UPI0024171CD6|nr:hypothetical protein [Asanoa sp. WMMD1127]MDG4821532.1 hypothetical protein [Asanoa sp. WMMD1127]
MDQADQAVDWAGDRLGSYDRWALVPLLLVALYLVVALLFRRVLPVLLDQVVAPLAVLAVGVVGIGALTLEFLAAQPFRLARRPPPRLLYAVGDLTVGAIPTVQRWLRGLGRQVWRLAWLRGWVVLLVAAAVLAWWNHGWCDRHAGASCAAPVTAWQSTVGDWWRDVTR